MNEQFRNITEIEQVQDVIYFSFDGRILFRYLREKRAEGFVEWDLSLFSAALAEIQEAELVFENSALYIVRAAQGFLLVVMRRPAPAALVRLNCSILLPQIDREFRQKPGGLTRFFRRKK